MRAQPSFSPIVEVQVLRRPLTMHELAKGIDSVARGSGSSGEQFATAGRLSWEIPPPGSISVPGPGEYRPDATEGITRIDDLPRPNVGLRSRNYRRRP
jgi:hypothetical protein